MGLLHDAGLANIYTNDIHGLNSLLDAMGQRGMPVDEQARQNLVAELRADLDTTMAQIQALVPTACKPAKTYKHKPARIPEEQLRCDDAIVSVSCCAYCSAKKPNKRHTCWKTQPAKSLIGTETTRRWTATLPFILSPKSLLAYCLHGGYRVPTKQPAGDSRKTMDETALLKLVLAHPDDSVLPLVWQYRTLVWQLWWIA